MTVDGDDGGLLVVATSVGTGDGLAMTGAMGAVIATGCAGCSFAIGLIGAGSALASAIAFGVADDASVGAGGKATAASLVGVGNALAAGAGVTGTVAASFATLVGRGMAGIASDRAVGSRVRFEPSGASIDAGDPVPVATSALCTTGGCGVAAARTGKGATLATSDGMVTGETTAVAEFCAAAGFPEVSVTTAVDFAGGAATRGVGTAGDASALAAAKPGAMASFGGNDGGFACCIAVLRDVPGDCGSSAAIAFAAVGGEAAVAVGRLGPAKPTPAGLAAFAGDFATIADSAVGGRTAIASAPTGASGADGPAAAGAALLTSTGRPGTLAIARRPPADGSWAIFGASTSLPMTSDPAPAADGAGSIAAMAGFTAMIGAVLSDDSIATVAGFAGAMVATRVAPAAGAGADGGSTACFSGTAFAVAELAGLAATTGAADADASDDGAVGAIDLFATGALGEARISGGRIPTAAAGVGVAKIVGAAAIALPVLGSVDTILDGDMIGDALPEAANSRASNEAGDADGDGSWIVADSGLAGAADAAAGAAVNRTAAGATLVSAGGGEAACFPGIFSASNAGDDRCSGEFTGLASSAGTARAADLIAALAGVAGALAFLVSVVAVAGEAPPLAAASCTTATPAGSAGAAVAMTSAGAPRPAPCGDGVTTGAEGFGVGDDAAAAADRVATGCSGSASGLAGGVTDGATDGGSAAASLAELETGKVAIPELPAGLGDIGSFDRATTIDSGAAGDAALPATDPPARDGATGFAANDGSGGTADGRVATVGRIFAGVGAGVGDGFTLADDALDSTGSSSTGFATSFGAFGAGALG